MSFAHAACECMYGESDILNMAVIATKSGQIKPYYTEMPPKHADIMANSADLIRPPLGSL